MNMFLCNEFAWIKTIINKPLFYKEFSIIIKTKTVCLYFYATFIFLMVFIMNYYQTTIIQ